MLEDWDFSLEDLREYSDGDSIDLYYTDNYEFDSDLISSDEDYIPVTQRTSTPWKAQTRSIPPLFVYNKEKCSDFH